MNSMLLATTSVILSLTLALVSAESLEPRIIGGQYAKKNQFPYIVSIRRKADDAHFCAGVIITPLWVLSAEHCFKLYCNDCTADQFVIVSEILNIEDKGRRTEIDKIRTNSELLNSPRANDLVLLKAKKPLFAAPSTTLYNLGKKHPIINGLVNFIFGFKQSDFEKMIKLGPIHPHLEVTLVGWGVESKNSSNISSKLKYTDLWTVESSDSCENTLSIACACLPDGGSSCMGDGGGPVIHRNERNDIILVGIVNELNCAPGQLENIIRVYPYIKWIKNEVEDEKTYME